MSPALSAALGLVALITAAAALVLATVANRRWAQRPRPRTAVAGADGGVHGADDPLVTLGRQLDALAGEVGSLRARVEPLDAAVADLREADSGLQAAVAGLGETLGDPRDPTALRHVAVVRYDAFGDVGGRLSYSVALLDDTRSGLVLTTLAGKSDVRTYVRTVSAGSGDGTLTAEEQQAIDAAAAGAPGSQP